MLFALAAILAGMLFTYSANDSSWFRISDAVITNNKFGRLGADVSDIIFSVFGVSGWWLVVGIFYLGYRKIIRKQIHTGNWYSIFQVMSFILLVFCSSILEYVCLYSKLESDLHNGYGGMLGKFFFHQIAIHVGSFAAGLSTLIVLMVCFSCVFSVSLLMIAEEVGFILEVIYIGITKLFVRKTDALLLHQDQINQGDDNESRDLLFYNEHNDDEEVEDEVPDDLFGPELVTSMNAAPNDANVTSTFFQNRKRKVAVEEDELELGIEKAAPKLSRIKASQNTGLLPSTSLLNSPPPQPLAPISSETLEYVSSSIENKLAEFGVEAKIVNADTGPVITRYELLPSRGVRGEKIVGLGKEIARGLALTNVRIVETIPGKNSMGIEVPNFKRQIIYLKEIFDSDVYKKGGSKLTLALGKDIAGKVVVTDLAKMPHLLVAGTTGSGKSVAVNAMILSVLFQATPDEVKFIMIDPKMVELSFYQDIPHLLAPVVTDMTQAGNALKWTVGEMERRYRTMAKVGCKNIVSFNQKIMDAAANGETIPDPFSFNMDSPEDLVKWPYIIVIIDELADLMMVTGKKTEQYIARIAQKARAIGIHLIVATQRPSVDVITGLIKANIPARISFQVSSKIDSRTILDQMGAEALLGQGDMLFLQPGSGFPTRIHGAFVNDDELNKVVAFLKTTGKPEYVEEVLMGGTDGAEIPGLEGESNDDAEKDSMFDEAVKFIYDTKRCSISSLQTRFGIGYNRAARIMNHLEKIGMVKRNDRGAFELLRNTQAE